MTRDEILSMSAGREMDALIAEKVMGLKVDYEFEEFGGLRVPSLIDKYDDWGYLPDYSTDISAAWQVVDKMRKSFWIASLVADTNLWRVQFYNPKKLFEAISESVALAICRAALLAVME